MHEHSLVRSLLTQVLDILANEPSGRVRAISVSIGPLSGVEPELVRIAFDHLATSFGLGDATLSVIETTLDARCLECEDQFCVEQFRFRCPNCDSGRVRVVGGDDFRLLDLTVEDTLATETVTAGSCANSYRDPRTEDR